MEKLYSELVKLYSERQNITPNGKNSTLNGANTINLSIFDSFSEKSLAKAPEDIIILINLLSRRQFKYTEKKAN
jgi:hypothetical protein